MRGGAFPGAWMAFARKQPFVEAVIVWAEGSGEQPPLPDNGALPVPTARVSRRIARLGRTNMRASSTVHAFQGRSVDTVIAAMEANHPHLTTQKTLYVEISRAPARAELVTDDKAALRETLEAVIGERIAALEAVEPERAKDRAAGLDADRSAGRDGGASESRQPERGSEPNMEEARTPKSVDRDLGL